MTLFGYLFFLAGAGSFGYGMVKVSLAYRLLGGFLGGVGMWCADRARRKRPSGAAIAAGAINAMLMLAAGLGSIYVQIAD